MADIINLSTIQQLIDECISKYGTNGTYALIDAAKKSAVHPLGKNYFRINFIANVSIEHFGLKSPEKIGASSDTQYQKARWTIFYLTLKHTDFTYEEIRKYFDLKTLGPIQYGERKIKELIANFHIDKEHYRLFCEVEDRVKRILNL